MGVAEGGATEQWVALYFLLVDQLNDRRGLHSLAQAEGGATEKWTERIKSRGGAVSIEKLVVLIVLWAWPRAEPRISVGGERCLSRLCWR